MVAVKEDQIKELKIIPFDLTPTAVDEHDHLVIPQHPVSSKESTQQDPIGISLGSVKKIKGSYLINIWLYN